MKVFGRAFIIIFLTLSPTIQQSKGEDMIPQSWCSERLQHGALAADSGGNLYVIDGLELRKFAYRDLARWYKTGMTPICVFRSADFAEYLQGEDILFRPDQDLEEPTLLHPKQSSKVYLWYRGLTHRLEIPVKSLKLTNNQIYSISRLTFESLEHGPAITSTTIIEGTVISRQEKSFIFTRHGLRPISKVLLPRLNTSPYGPIQLNEKKFATLASGPKFELIDKLTIPNNTLIRGSNPERLYLLKNSKRYFLWTSQAISRLGLKNKPIVQLTDDELYLIPFAQRLF